MPRSDPGSRPAGPPAARRLRSGGFTLIELMMVVALVAVAAGVVSLALRDGAQTRLDHEAVRLATLLETARAEARAAALPVQWMLTPDSDASQFRFVGLPASRRLPGVWLDPEVRARIVGERGTVQLGPEPLIGAQRVQLQLGERLLDVATDGLGPFTVVASGSVVP